MNSLMMVLFQFQNLFFSNLQFKSFYYKISRQYYLFIERDLKSDFSLKNIIKNKKISEDILPSTDVHFDVQKQETGSAYPVEKGELGKCKNLGATLEV